MSDTVQIGDLLFTAEPDGPDHVRLCIGEELDGQVLITFEQWLGLKIAAMSSNEAGHDRREVVRLRASLELHKDLEVRRVRMLDKLRAELAALKSNPSPRTH